MWGLTVFRQDLYDFGRNVAHNLCLYFRVSCVRKTVRVCKRQKLLCHFKGVLVCAYVCLIMSKHVYKCVHLCVSVCDFDESPQIQQPAAAVELR